MIQVAPGRAQDTREPFDRLDVSLHAIADTGNQDFHDYWDAGRGLGFEAATPFYAGSLATLVRFIHNDAVRGAGTPSVNAWGLQAGWWAGRDVTGGMRLSLGASLGITQWEFPDEDNDALGRESEIGIEAGARVGWSFTPSWGVAVTGSLQRTFTHDRIDLVLVSVGVVRTFGMPEWLRAGLR
ncbi:MAG TPA: hypothetical protein VFT13_10545 [Candidatus Krumholzibacteria bacterium]|nr:hypothetical protein [Candidatus Krumholzibacteria bacterium]